MWRVQSYSEPNVIWLDTGFGVAGLSVMTTTIFSDDRTAWMNWMCPLTIGASTGASVAIEGKRSMAVPSVLGSAYLLSVRSCLRGGGSQVATAFANTASYAGFYTRGQIRRGQASERLGKRRRPESRP